MKICLNQFNIAISANDSISNVHVRRYNEETFLRVQERDLSSYGFQ